MVSVVKRINCHYYYFRGPSSGQCCIFAGLQFLYRPGTRANNKDNAMYMKLQCNGFINVNKIKTNDNGKNGGEHCERVGCCY